MATSHEPWATRALPLEKKECLTTINTDARSGTNPATRHYIHLLSSWANRRTTEPSWYRHELGLIYRIRSTRKEGVPFSTGTGDPLDD